jgi:hypothetical protein
MAYRIADLVEQVKHTTSNASMLTKGEVIRNSGTRRETANANILKCLDM